MKILEIIKEPVEVVFVDQTFELPERANLLFETIQILTDMNQENLLWSWFLLLGQLLQGLKKVVVGEELDEFLLLMGSGRQLKK